jgi:small subunit ribosomal protein S6
LKSHVYETLFILDSNRYARDPSGVSGTIPTMIEKLGGEVLANRLWIEQRLSYPIKGHRKGTYWLTYFRLDAEHLSEFNRQCKLNENILRNLTLSVEPRLVDVLVAHARGGKQPGATTEKPPAPAAAAIPLPAESLNELE